MAEETPQRRSPGRPRRDQPHPIDVHVGRQIRLRRTLLGMSQEKLGEALGVTFQQVQKYERGANRIGASRLYELSQVLDVPVAFFFPEQPPGAAGPQSGGLQEEATPFESDPLTKRETMQLARAYYRIADPAVRRRLYELARSLAHLGEAEEG